VIQDHVSLLSVGIDIGSSGTQVIFSRINLRRMGEELSSRYFVVFRERCFRESRSPLLLTSESSSTMRNWEPSSRAFGGRWTSSGRLDTGVVILTGEALRRENPKPSRAFLRSSVEICLRHRRHHMESMLAAFSARGARYLMTREALLNSTFGGGHERWERGISLRPQYTWAGAAGHSIEGGGSCGSIPPGAVSAAQAGFRWSPRLCSPTPASNGASREWMAEAILASFRSAPFRRSAEPIS